MEQTLVKGITFSNPKHALIYQLDQYSSGHGSAVLDAFSC